MRAIALAAALCVGAAPLAGGPGGVGGRGSDELSQGPPPRGVGGEAPRQEKGAVGKGGDVTPPAQPHRVPGLELDPPQKRTRAGYLKVAVRTEARAEDEITIDVEAQLEGPNGEDPEFTSERLDAKTVLVAIPRCRGAIRVSACAVVGGKITPIAKTVIEVDTEGKPAPAPAGPPRGAARAGQPAPPAPGRRATQVFFVLDRAKADVNLYDLLGSRGFRNDVRALGLTPRLFNVDGPAVRELRLLPEVEAAGGQPALVLADENDRPLARARVPAGRAAILALLAPYANRKDKE